MTRYYRSDQGAPRHPVIENGKALGVILAIVFFAYEGCSGPAPQAFAPDCPPELHWDSDYGMYRSFPLHPNDPWD